MMPRPRRSSFVLAALALAAAASAQDLLPKSSPESRAIVLQNAVVHTMDGATLLGGTVWFRDGVIRGVLGPGEGLRLPEGVEALWIDASNKHVYPGLFAAHTQLGLIEVGMVRQTVDVDEHGQHSPEALAGIAVNPDSAAIPVARHNGVLAGCVFPVGGEMPGRTSVVQLDGWTNADMSVLADAGLVVDWPAEPAPRGRRGRNRTPTQSGDRDPLAAVRKARERLDETFARAAAWHAARRADPSTPPDLQAEAMGPALRGERPVFVLADELEEIESALRFANKHRLRPVVVGGRDSWLCADLLVERKVPVILTGVHRLPARDDSAYDEPFTLPLRLDQKGVRFCIATGEEFAHERNLPYHAATAAAFGLPRERALQAITRDAAAIVGCGDVLGTITVGKHATLMLTDGSPLELTTRVERAWIRGRESDLRSKQTELARKYREKYRQIGSPK